MLLSVVVPVYNEAQAIPYLVPALRSVLDRLEWEYEIVFVDDGSKDDSLCLLETLAEDDSRLKVFSFSRNFGHQAAITAGLDFAAGDAVVVMDADLQDPPEVLVEMLRFAWTAISSFSALPLRISTVLGFSLCLAGFLYLLYVLYGAFILHAVIPGWTSIVALQCLFSGVTLLGLGLVGDYVARIYEESKNRPLYVVSRVVNTSIQQCPAQRTVVLPRCQRASVSHAAPTASVQTGLRARRQDLEVLSRALVTQVDKKVARDQEPTEHH